MTTADEARAEAERRYREQIEATHNGGIIGCNHAGGHCGVWVKVAPVIESLTAQLQAGTEQFEYVRATNRKLIAQLQEAQATIAEALAANERRPDLHSIPIGILSRADTSALDAAIRAAKNEGWDEACQALAWCFDNGPERDALPYLIEHNPFAAASTEQTEADRG